MNFDRKRIALFDFLDFSTVKIFIYCEICRDPITGLVDEWSGHCECSVDLRQFPVNKTHAPLTSYIIRILMRHLYACRWLLERFVNF